MGPIFSTLPFWPIVTPLLAPFSPRRVIPLSRARLHHRAIVVASVLRSGGAASAANLLLCCRWLLRLSGRAISLLVSSIHE
jgi:hypothetical protein